MSNWESPAFIEVDMSAEIGGYQGEDDGRGNEHIPKRQKSTADHETVTPHA